MGTSIDYYDATNVRPLWELLAKARYLQSTSVPKCGDSVTAYTD